MFALGREGTVSTCSHGVLLCRYNGAMPRILKVGLPVVLVGAITAAVLVLIPRGGNGDVEIVPDPPDRVRVVTDKSPGISEVATPASTTVKPKAGTAKTETGPGGTGSGARASEVGDGSDGAVPSSTRAMIATAKVSTVHIVASPPEGVTSTPLATPAPRGSELPNDRLSIVGRHKTDAGWEIANPEPYGGTAAFWVVQQAEGWVRVMVPVRPNNQTGWIRTDEVDLSETGARVHIDLSDRRLTAFNDAGTRIVDTAVAVGAAGSPTPVGWFSITDISPSNPGGTYGPSIVGTSGLSEVLERFDSGAPQIAMHGWQNPSAFGRAVSNGCVRVPNSQIVKIAGLPRGAPVVVEA